MIYKNLLLLIFAELVYFYVVIDKAATPIAGIIIAVVAMLFADIIYDELKNINI